MKNDNKLLFSFFMIKNTYLSLFLLVPILFGFSANSFSQNCGVNCNCLSRGFNSNYSFWAVDYDQCLAHPYMSSCTKTNGGWYGQDVCAIVTYPGETSNCPIGYVGVPPNCISIASGDGENIGDSSHSTCNPINISTGNKFFQFTDYQDKHFQFSHSYNSVTGSWRFAYQQRLLINATYFVVAERMDGKGIHFINDNGAYHSSTQRREQLAFDGTNYTLTFSDNTVETYDTTGRLLSIASPNELFMTLNYTATTVTLTTGDAELTFTLGASNEVTQATFPNGSSIVYNYQIVSGNPLLETLTNAQGTMRRYFYEDSRFPTYITGVEDENANRISSVQYDDQGLAISSEKGPLNSGIERTQIQYNADGTRTLTNALGKQNVYHFTTFNGEYKMTQVEGIASNNCAAANKNYTYDTNGFMASKTDWKGTTTTYTNNNRGQELSRTEASGTLQAQTVTTEWHAEFNLPIKVIESTRESIMSYDTNGRLLSRQVQVRNN